MMVVWVLLGGCGDDSAASQDMAVPADLSMSADLTPVVVSIVVSPATPKIVVGDLQAFTAMAAYSDASGKDVTATAAWSSTDSAVATVDAAGKATGVGKGTASIKATLGGVSSVAVPLAVRAVESIAITWSGVGMPTTGGGDLQLTATATLSDADTLDVTMRAAWTSSAANVIATIANGLAHPGTDKGTSDVTASFGGKVGMTTVLVQ
jgi:uncharacterized protein YjdB